MSKKPSIHKSHTNVYIIPTLNQIMKKLIFITLIVILFSTALTIAQETKGECEILRTINETCEETLIIEEFFLNNETIQRCIKADNTSICNETNSTTIQSCSLEGEICGGIAGFQCCNNLVCELEGDFPDAAGTCIQQTPPQQIFCEDLCGDNICQEIVCLGEDCPCPETFENCPEDCQPIVEEPAEEPSNFPTLIVIIIAAIAFIIIGLKILKWLFWSLAIIAAIIVLYLIFL